MTRMITQSSLTVNGISLNTPPLPSPPRATVAPTVPVSLTVACVWWGTLYGVEYVERLRDMVARNLQGIPYDFVCITDHDVPEGVIRYPSPINYKGWWQKIGLFAPDLFGPSSRILYLDLDVVLVNSINRLVSCAEEFVMIENFGPNKSHAAHNSSVMLWTPTEASARIFNHFSTEVVNHLHGDQCWIWRVMQDGIVDFPRDWVVSYKYEKIPQYRCANRNTAIYVFHGKPKPHECRNDKLISQHWR